MTVTECVSGTDSLTLLRDKSARPRIPRYLNANVIKHTLDSSTISAKAMAGTDALVFLKDSWRLLEKACAGKTTAFQTFDWCFAWASTHCNEPSVTPYVVTVYQGDRLVLIWPLMLTGFGRFRLLRWLGAPHTRFGDVLARPGPRLQSYLETAWQHIEQTADAAAVQLSGVRHDAVAFRFLERNCQIARKSAGTTCLNLAALADKAAYDRRYTTEEQQRQQRTHTELERFGAIEFTAHTGPGHLDAVLDRTIAAQTLLSPRNNGSTRSKTDLSWTALLRTLANQDASNLQLVMSVLKAGPRPVSYEIGLRCNAHHLCCLTAYDKDLARYAPNQLHIYLSQVQALKDGLETFEILSAHDTGAKAWSDYTVESSDFQSTFNFTGKLAISGVLQFAEPVVQWFVRSGENVEPSPVAAQHAMMTRVRKLHTQRP